MNYNLYGKKKLFRTINKLNNTTLCSLYVKTTQQRKISQCLQSSLLCRKFVTKNNVPFYNNKSMIMLAFNQKPLYVNRQNLQFYAITPQNIILPKIIHLIIFKLLGILLYSPVYTAFVACNLLLYDWKMEIKLFTSNMPLCKYAYYFVQLHLKSLLCSVASNI